MQKSALLSKIFTLGEFITPLSLALSERGFNLPLIYQESFRKVAARYNQVPTLDAYWVERAKEYIALHGSKYSVQNGVYPEAPIYKSELIEQLRLNFSSYANPEPTHIFFDGETLDAQKARQELHDQLLTRRNVELSNLEKTDYTIMQDYKLQDCVPQLFVKVFTNNGFTLDELRSNRTNFIVRRPHSVGGWQICCTLIHNYKVMLYPPIVGLFLFKDNSQIDLWGRHIDKNTYIEIKAIDVCPGIQYYPWRVEHLPEFMLSLKAYHALFLELSQKLSDLASDFDNYSQNNGDSSK